MIGNPRTLEQARDDLRRMEYMARRTYETARDAGNMPVARRMLAEQTRLAEQIGALTTMIERRRA